jgi:hypothetical protein
MVDLLDNCQTLLSFILLGMAGGKEKKNGGSSTADQVKDWRKRLKQKLSQIESPIKHIL